jgi:hypothetical protein
VTARAETATLRRARSTPDTPLEFTDAVGKSNCNMCNVFVVMTPRDLADAPKAWLPRSPVLALWIKRRQASRQSPTRRPRWRAKSLRRGTSDINLLHLNILGVYLQNCRSANFFLGV